MALRPHGRASLGKKATYRILNGREVIYVWVPRSAPVLPEILKAIDTKCILQLISSQDNKEAKVSAARGLQDETSLVLSVKESSSVDAY